MFNAININLASGNNWYGPNDSRVIEAKNNMSNSLQNAFANIEGFEPMLGVGSGISTYTPQTWNNLGLQPSWGNTLNIGDVAVPQVPMERIFKGKIYFEIPKGTIQIPDLDVGVIRPPKSKQPGP